MTRRSVVALTEPGDTHLDLVRQYLDSEIIVISPRSLVSGEDLSFEICPTGQSRVVFKGNELEVESVWYRKPKPYDAKDLPVSEGFRQYAHEAQQSHYGLLYSAFPKALWVSDYYAIRRMSSKFVQLKLAKDCGFRIPESLFTSDSTEARAFIDRMGECIVKIEAQHFPVVDGKQTFFFARKVRKDAMPDLSGLHLAPAIFQQAIDVDYDVRVAVVDKQSFASIITNEGLAESDIRDWRLGHSEETIHFAEHKIPKDIADKCIEFTRCAGLRFGAFDFVVDSKGRYWFIEDNPNGQWAFVEETTREKIAQAMAGLLRGGSVKAPRL